MGSLQRRASRFAKEYAELDAVELLDVLVNCELRDRIAMVSSFGTEFALLLALAAEVNRALPVLFIDTGKLFSETLDYRDRLIDLLGLSDVRTIGPSQRALTERDPTGELWQFDPDACCNLRKVEPLAEHVVGFDGLISGRKRYHGALREFIPSIEYADGKIKIDPLATWSQERVETEFGRRGLPQHPLKALGFPSVGCEPCTMPVGDGGSIRDGRWAGRAKTECGIHLPAFYQGENI